MLTRWMKKKSLYVCYLVTIIYILHMITPQFTNYLFGILADVFIHLLCSHIKACPH